MTKRTWPHEVARDIAETAADCADKALHWKARALAAEEALSKFAGEIYRRQTDEQIIHAAREEAALLARAFNAVNRSGSDRRVCHGIAAAIRALGAKAAEVKS